LTAELISPPSTRSGASWSARASRRRREQLLGRAPAADSPVQHLWASLVDVLGAIDGPSTALLATAGGDPVAVHGLAGSDVARVARQDRAVFGARVPAPLPDGPTPVETVELTLGLRHTVIASVPAKAGDGHLLSVTAQGVSIQVLEAWTRRLAEDIRAALSVAGR
jgi:hypothetical protein